MGVSMAGNAKGVKAAEREVALPVPGKATLAAEFHLLKALARFLLTSSAVWLAPTRKRRVREPMHRIGPEAASLKLIQHKHLRGEKGTSPAEQGSWGPGPGKPEGGVRVKGGLQSAPP